MNLGQIPGFYYDSEKKKYFKIQANHAAPTGAKYAKSSVKREERETKKRKVEDRKQQKRLKQTVKRLPQHALINGIGLEREGGLQRRVVGYCARDAAFVSQLQPREHDLGEEVLLDAVPFTAGRVIFANSCGMSNSIISVASYYGHRSERIPSSARCEPSPRRRTRIGALNSTIIGLHSICEDNGVSTFAGVAQEAKLPGNVFIGSVSEENRLQTANYLLLGGMESSLWSSALRPSASELAICGTEDVFVVDTRTANVAHALHGLDESRDLAWLDFQTIAYAQHSPGDDHVALWDLRSSGRSIRFLHKRPITGIKSPDRHGVQLLVSSNRRLDLYDTRMEKAALLSFPHVHQGPQLQFDVKEGVVAALDADNLVQTYSLRSGKTVGSLKRHSDGNAGLLRKLRWLEDANGVPILQACLGGSMIKWSWGGNSD